MRRLIAAALLPAILLLGFTPSYAVYRCNHDGALRRQCCCPALDQVTQHSPAVSDRCCCDLQTMHATLTPAAPAPAPAKTLAAPTACAALAVLAAPPALRERSPLTALTRSFGPPPLQRKQSLLL